MLHLMRQFAGSWFAKGMLTIIIFSFAVWGIADIFRGSADTSLAQVGGIAIEPAEFQRTYDNDKKRQENRLGAPISAQQARSLGLPKQALDQLIGLKALDLVASHLGLTVSDDDVAQQIREMPAFQGASGGFDRARFLEVIRQSGYTEDTVVQAMRSDMARGQLMNAAADGLTVPPGYGRAFFDFLSEQRAVSYLTVPASAAGSVPPPSDLELQAFVRQHKERFSTPEYREFSYIAITADALGGDIRVTDQQLQNEFELHHAEYQVAEKRVVEQLQFPDEKTAKEGQAKLAGGMSFEDLAISRGMRVADIQLGALSQADLGGERGAAIFALKPGQVTPPLKALIGYAIYKVVAVNPGVNKTLADVKPALLAEVRQKLAVEKIGDLATKLQDALAGGANIAKAGQSIGVPVVHVKAMDRQGLAPDGSKVAVPADAQFLDQVFKTEPGAAGDPFTAQNGSAYSLQITGVTPPRLKPLEQVREQAAKEWTSERARQAMMAKISALVAEANRAGSLEPVAKALNAKVQQSPALQRGSQNETFPAYLTQAIFAAPPGGTVSGKTADGVNFVIARVTGIAHPPAGIEAVPQYRQFQQQLANQIQADIPTTLALAAKQRAGVTINQKNLDAITGNGQ